MRADYLLPGAPRGDEGAVTTLSVSAESGVQRVVDEIVDKKLDLRAIRRGRARARRPRACPCSSTS